MYSRHTNPLLNSGISPQVLARLGLGLSGLEYQAQAQLSLNDTLDPFIISPRPTENSLDADTEDNLRLLAQYCSRFSCDSSLDAGPGHAAGNNEISEQVASTSYISDSSSSVETTIMIATPVPLPYTARSSDVLERMISGPKETFVHPTLAEQLERAGSKSVDTPDDSEQSTNNDPVANSLTLIRSPRLASQTVFRPIRPISPSTLIALTEPCLMDWSTRVPLSVPPQLQRAVTNHPQVMMHHLERSAPLVSAYGLGINSGRNSWGY